MPNNISYDVNDPRFTHLVSFAELYRLEHPSTDSKDSANKFKIEKPVKLGSFKLDKNRDIYDLSTIQPNDYQPKNNRPTKRKSDVPIEGPTGLKKRRLKSKDESTELKEASASTNILKVTLQSDNPNNRPYRTVQNLKSYPLKVNILSKPFNLNLGHEFLISKQNKNIKKGYPAGLGTLLSWQEKMNCAAIHYDFICWRGILQRIMSGFISAKSKFTADLFAVVKSSKNKTIHLYNLPTVQNNDSSKSEFLNQLCYQGRSFERFVSNELPIDEDHPVNENEESVNVYRNNIGGFSVLYGAEMDFDNCLEDGTTESYELKTTSEIWNDSTKLKFLQKSQKWWAQCFLVNVKKLIIGYRHTKTGFCYKFSECETKDLVKLAVSEKLWRWETGVLALQELLIILKTKIVVEDKLYVLKLDYVTSEVDWFQSDLVIDDLNF